MAKTPTPLDGQPHHGPDPATPGPKGTRAEGNSAIEGAVRAHADQVLRHASKIVGHDAAQDVAQEVFLKLGDSDLQVIHNLGAWLSKSARHASIDEMRKSKRRPALLGSGDKIHEPVSHEKSPPQGSEDREEKERLQRVIDSLTDEQRILLRCRYQEGLALRDIAPVLSLKTQGAVSKRLSEVHGIIEQALTRTCPRPEPGLKGDTGDAVRDAVGGKMSADLSSTLLERSQMLVAALKRSRWLHGKRAETLYATADWYRSHPAFTINPCRMASTLGDLAVSCAPNSAGPLAVLYAMKELFHARLELVHDSPVGIQQLRQLRNEPDLIIVGNSAACFDSVHGLLSQKYSLVMALHHEDSVLLAAGPSMPSQVFLAEETASQESYAFHEAEIRAHCLPSANAISVAPNSMLKVGRSLDTGQGILVWEPIAGTLQNTLDLRRLWTRRHFVSLFAHARLIRDAARLENFIAAYLQTEAYCKEDQSAALKILMRQFSYRQSFGNSAGLLPAG